MALTRLLGKELLPAARQAAVPTLEALSGASAIGLYFSASWCPPCRGFTPQLAQAYTQHLQARGLRCVFLSGDHDEQDFAGYFEGMPWLALPYAERSRKEALSGLFGVRTIPTLALVDPNGRLLTASARDRVVEDPEGLRFPWAEPTVGDFANGPGMVNLVPSVVLLCEDSSQAEQAAAKAALEVVAGEELPIPNTGEADETAFPPLGYGFFIASGGDLTKRVRHITRLHAGNGPQLVLLDIPAEGCFYEGPAGEEAMGEAAIRKLVGDYAAGRLERQQLL